MTPTGMTATDESREALLQQSWRDNAGAWSDAVREGRIASRREATDQAIVDAALSTGARRILDIGCGEGWLARALVAHGRDAIGVDGSAELVASARACGGARYAVSLYGSLAALDLGEFDLAIFNFALLGADVAGALADARDALGNDGRLLIQTVHPWTACGDAPYRDGWRVETFAAFGDGFRTPMPWYFRTLASWSDALAASGFRVLRWAEPYATGGRPLSLLIEATRNPNVA